MRTRVLLSTSMTMVIMLSACKPAVTDTTPPTLTWAATTVDGRFKGRPDFVFPGPVSVRLSAEATDDLDEAPLVMFLNAAGNEIEPQFDVLHDHATCIIHASDAAGNVTQQVVTMLIGPYIGEATGTLLALTDDAMLSATLQGVFADRLDTTRFMAVPLDGSGVPIRAPAMPATSAVWLGPEWKLRFPLDPDAAQFRIVGLGNNLNLSFTAAPQRISGREPTLRILKPQPPE